jgi:hypothetical protein
MRSSGQFIGKLDTRSAGALSAHHSYLVSCRSYLGVVLCCRSFLGVVRN